MKITKTPVTTKQDALDSFQDLLGSLVESNKAAIMSEHDKGTLRKLWHLFRQLRNEEYHCKADSVKIKRILDETSASISE